MSDVCTDYCLRCVYYEKHLKNCAFLELTGKIRGCDPGDGCTARILKRGGHRRAGDATWDVGLAQQLYLQGLTLKAIAEQVHVHPTTVGNYARKQCRLTGEYLADTRGRGYWCPLHIEKKEENHGNPCVDPG